MKCPKCGHEPTMNEHAASPEKCPSCGVYYAKAATPMNRQALEAAERERLAAQRRERASASRTSGPANPVVVVDLQMPFNSMVVFMVKWALASIPAVMILAAAAAVAFALLGAMFGAK